MASRLAEVEALMVGALGFAAPGHPLDGIARAHLATGGKRLRARLALAASAALGGATAPAAAWAAACELAHNATLVHDDLQDGDRVRRGQPTTWVAHGMAQAINAGDLMLMLPYALACDAGDAGGADGAALARALCRALAVAMARVIRGQAAECALLGQPRLEQAAYDTMVAGKTAALFELPVLGAARLAGADAAAAAATAAPFAELGVLFQMQDDVLDLFGDKGREARGSDLREGKVSALVMAHLALHPAEAPGLLALLRRPRAETADRDVDATIARFAEGGARAAVLAAIAARAGAARAAVAAPLLPLMQALIDRVMQPIAHL